MSAWATWFSQSVVAVRRMRPFCARAPNDVDRRHGAYVHALQLVGYLNGYLCNPAAM